MHLHTSILKNKSYKMQHSDTCYCFLRLNTQISIQYFCIIYIGYYTSSHSLFMMFILLAYLRFNCCLQNEWNLMLH